MRGTASTVAEKYISLSRDAFSMGDRVKAENYLQHAEHYLRIQAEAKEAKQQAQQVQQSQQPQQVDPSPEAQAREGGPQGETVDDVRPAAENRIKTRRARPARPQNVNGGEQKEASPRKKPSKSKTSDAAPAKEKAGGDDADGVAA